MALQWLALRDGVLEFMGRHAVDLCGARGSGIGAPPATAAAAAHAHDGAAHAGLGSTLPSGAAPAPSVSAGSGGGGGGSGDSGGGREDGGDVRDAARSVLLRLLVNGLLEGRVTTDACVMALHGLGGAGAGDADSGVRTARYLHAVSESFVAL